MEDNNSLLKDRKINLLKSINDMETGKKVIGAIGFITIVAAVIFFYQNYLWTSIILGILGLIVILVILSVNSDVELNEISQIDNELQLEDIAQNSAEKKAEQLFKNHQLEIKKYYDLTLKNSRHIFLTGLMCIAIGVVFVVLTYFVIANTKPNDGNEKILYGVIGLLSTFMTNYIGSIFLKMHAETVKSLGEFHSRLVNTHHLHFANYISQTISDKEMKNKVLSDLILKMIDSDK